MEFITSRKNRAAAHFRALARDADYRREAGEYVCDGLKLLHEAMACGAGVRRVLWREAAAEALPAGIEEFAAPAELFEYISPLKDSRGPVFSVAMPRSGETEPGDRVIVLENVQDPGNVGTVLRTANALGFDTVALCGACADIYNPKTVRASMGAIFRQHVLTAEPEQLRAALTGRGMKLWGAALAAGAADLRRIDLTRCAVAIGSEGSGLSERMLSLCDGLLIIPMQPGSESLNAAVAAAIVMWEAVRQN